MQILLSPLNSHSLIHMEILYRCQPLAFISSILESVELLTLTLNSLTKNINLPRALLLAKSLVRLKNLSQLGRIESRVHC